MTTKRERPWWAKNTETFEMADSSPWSDITGEDRTKEIADTVTKAEREGATSGKFSSNQYARMMAGGGESDQAIRLQTTKIFKTPVTAIQWNYTGD